MPHEEKQPIKLLLVEDNLGDADLMREALEEGDVSPNIVLTRDGFETLKYLRSRGESAAWRRLDIIILDLNLPKKDGREVLAEIKSDENLKEIPVIVLTTSMSEEDVRMSYRLGANSFIMKPMGVDQLFDVVRKIEDYWFRIEKLPTE